MKNQIRKALNLFLVPEFYFFGAVATWFQIWAALFVTGAWKALRTTEVPVIIALADPYWVIVTAPWVFTGLANLLILYRWL